MPLKHQKKDKKKKVKAKTNIKQKQSQHQTININLNNVKHAKRKHETKHSQSVQRQQPTIFYNPSLATPNYGIHNRLSVNPPLPDEPLMVSMNELVQPEKVPSGIPLLQPSKPEPAIISGIPIAIPSAPDFDKSSLKPVEIRPIKPDRPSPVVPEVVGQIIGSSKMHEQHENNKSNKIDKTDFLGEHIVDKNDGVKLKEKFKIGDIALKTLSALAVGASGGALTGAAGAFAAGSSISEGLMGGAILGGLTNAGSEIGGTTGATLGASVAGGLITRYKYKQIQAKNKTKETNDNKGTYAILPPDEPKPPKKLSKLEILERDKEIDRQIKARTTKPKSNKTGYFKLPKKYSGNEIRPSDYIGEYEILSKKQGTIRPYGLPQIREKMDVPILYHMTPNESHLLGSHAITRPKRKELWPWRLNSDVNKEKVKLDKAKELFEQNLKRALETPEQEARKIEVRKNLFNQALIASPALRRVKRFPPLTPDQSNAGNTLENITYTKAVRKDYTKQLLASNTIKDAFKIHKARVQLERKRVKFEPYKRLQNLLIKMDGERNDASSTIKAAIKRSEIQPIYQIGIQQNHAASTIQAAIKRSDVQPIYQNAKQIKHEETANILQQAIRGHQAKKELRNRQIENATNQKAATTIQSALRNKNARDELGSKREIANYKNEMKASSRIQARVKTKLTYQFKTARQFHETQHAGKPLVVLKGTSGADAAFILKERHDRGVKAAETRKANKAAGRLQRSSEVLQRAVRVHQARKELKERKEK